jgi:hypothetical protein
MRILNVIQLILCLFAMGWLTTAAYNGWKAGPPPSQATAHPGGGYYYGGTHYYGGSSYSGGSRSSGGSWGGGK